MTRSSEIAEFMSQRIFAAIRDRPLCVPCIAREVAIGDAVIRDTIHNAPVEFAIKGGERVCGRCDIIRHTYVILPPRIARSRQPR